MKPTLFLYGAYGHLKVDDPNPFFATAGLPLDAENYYVKGGIRQNWTSLGHTVLYGEYLRNTDGILNTAFFLLGTGISTSSELNVWGLGVVQEIDAAAMSLWVKYRHARFDVEAFQNGVNLLGGLEYQDFQYVGAGALISF